MGSNQSSNESSRGERNLNNNPAIPSFIFSSEKLNHDSETPLPACCDNPGECRAYTREDDPGRAIGMYCKRCHAEWLDEDIYPFAKFDQKDQTAVDIVKLKSAKFDPCMSAAFNVSTGQRFLLTRRVTSTDRVTDLFRSLLMSIPQRTMIDRGLAAMNSLRPGDHVMWHRPWAVWHHQLIRRKTGRFKYDIIHFDTTDDQKLGFKVEVMERKARDFAEEHGTLYKINYSPSVERENPQALVFDRANAKLHERGYSLLTHNCEHVISFCKTGCPNSYQGNWLKRGLLFLIMRIVIISVVIVIASVIDDKISPGSEPWTEVVTSIPLSSPSSGLSVSCDNGINRRSQLLEGLVIPFLEVTMFAFVVWRHHKALREQGIDRLDFTRRVGEAMFELFCTVALYLSHIPIIYHFCFTVISDIVIALLLGISGKMIGFFLGQYLCQKTVVKRKLKSLKKLSKKPSHLLNASYESIRRYSSTDDHECV